ncbi:MAG TPA: hypothetical protein VF857_08970 [Spirochaetota bacterium]
MNFYRRIILLVVISLPLTGLMLMVNNVTLSVRMRELKIYLQKLDRSENKIDFVNLIARYNLNSRLYDKGLSDDEANMVEYKMSELALSRKSYDTVRISGTRYVSEFALMFINAIRFFIGKDGISESSESDLSDNLNTAYFFERNNIYDRALKFYAMAEKEAEKDGDLKAGIMIHKGFCYAMMSNYGLARDTFTDVMHKYGNNEVAVIAAVLLRYLDAFEREQKIVLPGKDDPLIKGEKMFRLMAYDKTLEIFKEVKDTYSGEDKAKISYFTARAYEETGKHKEAVKGYVETALMPEGGHYAGISARRIFQIGVRSNNNDVIETAVEINRFVKDPALDEMIMNRGASPASTADSGTAIEIEIPDSVRASILSRKQEQEKAPLAPKRVRIITGDGNTFVGTVISENQNRVVVKTLIGIIEIKRSDIMSRKNL